MGTTLMTLSFYLTLENPDILRSELTEQKMSMLYLKNQVNPHFLYNTLDTIRIQAQLGGDAQVAQLLMRLVNFFRRSVKVDRPMLAYNRLCAQPFGWQVDCCQCVCSIKQSIAVCIVTEVKCCFKHIPHKLHDLHDLARGRAQYV